MEKKSTLSPETPDISEKLHQETLAQLISMTEKFVNDHKDDFNKELKGAPISEFDQIKQHALENIQKIDGAFWKKMQIAANTFNENRDHLLSKSDNIRFNEDLLKVIQKGAAEPVEKDESDKNKPNKSETEKVNMQDSLQKQFGITNFMLYCFYVVGYTLFNEKRFEEASAIFFYLSVLNPLVKDYWMGLGLAEKSQQHYVEAISSLLMAEVMDATDPYPHLQTAECYLQLKDELGAEFEITEAKGIVELTKDESWNSELHRLELELSKMKNAA